MGDLRIKYRPTALEEVWGNDIVKKIWAGFVKSSNYPKSIVLHGSFGCAKSSYKRILKINCSNFAISSVLYSEGTNWLEYNKIRG